MELINYLNSLDHDLMVFLNYDAGSWADRFWFQYSKMGTWFPTALMMLAMLTLRFRHNWRKLLLCVGMIALCVLFTDQISSGIIKPWVARFRPSHDPLIQDLLHYVNGYHGGLYGFTSSHASNSWGIVMLFMLMFKGTFYRTTLAVFALGNCYSRIYLGVHFPGDIVCGTVIGLLVGWGIWRLWLYLSGLPAFTRHDTQLSIHEDRSYAMHPWPVTATYWLTVLTIAVAFAL